MYFRICRRQRVIENIPALIYSQSNWWTKTICLNKNRAYYCLYCIDQKKLHYVWEIIANSAWNALWGMQGIYEPTTAPKQISFSHLRCATATQTMQENTPYMESHKTFQPLTTHTFFHQFSSNRDSMQNGWRLGFAQIIPSAISNNTIPTHARKNIRHSYNSIW